MKNNPKSAIATTILAATLLAGHGVMKDAHSQVNFILCNKSWITEIKKWKITIYNDWACYISEWNSHFFEELWKIQKEQKFDEIVVYPFYSKSSWKNNMIIKIDWSQNETWSSDFYIYDAKTGTLKNLKSLTLEEAIRKVENQA